MRKRLAFLVLASAAIAGGCTAAGSSPATTPDIPDVPETTTTRAEITTTTTVSPQTTTTIDRISEVQAIFEDLERRRLQAIFDQDEEAFRAVYANEAYLEQSLKAYESLVVVDPTALVTSAFELLVDNAECLAAKISRDYRNTLESGGESQRRYILERVGDRWGLSWVGEGWECDGPHPLSS